MNRELQDQIGRIRPLYKAEMEKAAAYQMKLAKPPGSLGKLEDISIRLAGITGKLRNTVDRKRIIVLCADNGIVAEGVACAPQSVTAAQAVNMTKNLTGMSVLAKHFDCETVIVDMTDATERSLYGGISDIPLSPKGRSELLRRKSEFRYPDPKGLSFYTSGMKRTEETLEILYGRVPHVRVSEIPRACDITERDAGDRFEDIEIAEV